MQHLPKIVSEVSRGVPAETDPVWSKISNALKRLGFQSRNFLALLSETSRACTIWVRRSSGRPWNDLGSHACLHHRNRRPGTSTEERIFGRREPHPKSKAGSCYPMPKKLRWLRSLNGSDGKPWKNWRLSRSRIRCSPGTESASPTSSTDRSFANPGVVPELTRKPSGWWCLCQEDEKSSCCTKDEGRSFGAAL